MMSQKSWKALAGKTKNILLTYYNQSVFTHACVAVSGPGLEHVNDCLVYCGENNHYSDFQQGSETLFDLASLTKPLVTSLAILHLIEKGQLNWEDNLRQLLNKDIPVGLRDIDIASLLTHSSGLAAHRDFWKEALLIGEKERAKWILDTILAEVLVFQRGSKHLYSDLGYLLLGFIVENITGKNLAEYWYEVIATPLGIGSSFFFPGSVGIPGNTAVAPTGFCPWSGTELRGVVNDDNSRVIGGVSGHAGLFGSASAVLSLCVEILRLCRGDKSRLPISPRTFKEAARKAGGAEWTAGFNHPSPQGSSSGKHFSPESLGHLGFTGTSFWIDPKTSIIVVLLTNRVLMGDDLCDIQKLRPYLHDAIVWWLVK